MRDIFNRFHPPFFIYVIIFYFSSLPARNLDPFLPDYISHSMMYLGLSFFFFRLFPRPLTRKAMVLGVAILLLLAVLDEGHQFFIPGRLFSIQDIGYDCLGIVTGLVCRLGLYRYTQSQGKSQSL